jgi:hypothetical protein
MNHIHIDTNNPLHNDAFLLAAGHFLSNWPQDWNAERLTIALLADEDSEANEQEDQKQINVWEPIEKIQLHPMDEGSGFEYVYELIDILARDIVEFTIKHSQQ